MNEIHRMRLQRAVETVNAFCAKHARHSSRVYIPNGSSRERVLEVFRDLLFASISLVDEPGAAGDLLLALIDILELSEEES